MTEEVEKGQQLSGKVAYVSTLGFSPEPVVLGLMYVFRHEEELDKVVVLYGGPRSKKPAGEPIGREVTPPPPIERQAQGGPVHIPPSEGAASICRVVSGRGIACEMIPIMHIENLRDTLKQTWDVLKKLYRDGFRKFWLNYTTGTRVMSVALVTAGVSLAQQTAELISEKRGELSEEELAGLEVEIQSIYVLPKFDQRGRPVPGGETIHTFRLVPLSLPRQAMNGE